jgi:hypothetical protein
MPLHPNRVNTVGDLVAALSDYDPETPIRWAAQPRWAMAYTIGPIACTLETDAGDDRSHHTSLGDDADGHTADGTANDSGDDTDNDGPVVWLGEGQQIGYLPGVAAAALGWS